MAEKKPIIKVAFYKLREAEAYFRLSEDERKESMNKADKKSEELGVKGIMHCDCRWSNEEWKGFVVEEYPDIEALQKWTKFIEEELEWFRYLESKHYLGTRAEE